MIKALHKHFRPNRVEAYAAGLVALLLALVPVLADLDTSSTVSVIAGLAAVVAIVVARIPGWAQYEKFIYSIEVQARHAAQEEEAAGKLAAYRKGNPKAAGSSLALPR